MASAAAVSHVGKPISVLTWNICFGCMTNNKADKTGSTVVTKCIEKSKTKQGCQ